MPTLHVITPNGVQRDIDLDSILTTESNLDASKLVGIIPNECFGDISSVKSSRSTIYVPTFHILC